MESDRDRTLAAMLAARARRASDTRLAVDVIGGVAICTAALWVRPPAWHLALALGACLGTYGLWGITDRAIAEHAPDGGSSLKLLRAVRGMAALLGAIAMGALAISLFALALGTWIS